MPFTISHAVVALPLRRTAIPASAVAVGAMTPDLRLFVPFAPLYSTTHSLVWLPATVLLAAALWLGWRFVVAPASRDLSPAALARRYPGAALSARPGRVTSPAPARLAVGLALGVLTHVVWDAFTHDGRWGVEAVPALTRTIAGTPGYSWLQDGSGLLGLVVIAIWFARLPRRELDTLSRRAARPLRLATVGGVLAAVVAGLALGLVGGGPLWRVGYEAITTAVGWGAVVVLLGCVAWHAQRWHASRGGASQPDAGSPDAGDQMREVRQSR